MKNDAQFDDWLEQLYKELTAKFGSSGFEYVQGTGVECWHDMYKDGISASEAANTEYEAAIDSGEY